MKKTSPMDSILFLAPFGMMAETAQRLASDLGISLKVEVADDDHAIETVARHPQVDVVVSRGGVAERIKALDNISVVEIATTVDQYLDVISRFASQGMRRIGFVGRANILGGASGDFDIAGTRVYFRSCLSLLEIEQTFNALCEAGIDAIVGCRLGYDLAVAKGVPAERLVATELSVKRALEEAVRLVRAKEIERRQGAQLKAIVDNIDEGIVALDRERRIDFCNNIARRLCSDMNGTFNHRFVADLLAGGELEKITNIHGRDVLARSIPLEVGGVRVGDVITLQEGSSIQMQERKIRVSLHQKGLYAKKCFGDMLGESDSIRKLIEKAQKYASHDSNLLIYGETGTGKEVLAQSVHNASLRRYGPFVSVNTASLPPSLLESELFGYAEGAFTGAKKGGKPGLFELAHGGTIFLDEIGELTPDIQSRLLRVLQEKEIMRIGDDRIIPVDVRVISATNRDLSDLVREGGFREDLYYRIHVLGLRIPPLRERQNDVVLLFQSFLNELAKNDGRTISLTEAAIVGLKSYDWPGNIRQLKNVAEVIACHGAAVIDLEDVEEVLGGQETRIVRKELTAEQELEAMKQLEASALRKLLEQYPADEVCRKLGISRVTLWRRKNALLKGK